MVDRPEPCAHLEQESRLRVLRNRTRHIVWQCLACGGQVRPVRRDETDAREDSEWNIPFDEDLANTWSEQREADWQAWNAQQLEGHTQKNNAWWVNEYEPYMATEAWQEKRLRRLALDAHRCQAMLEGCTQRATDAHHLSYKHFGNEPLFEIISVCRPCHDQITEMDRRGRDAA